MMRELLLLLVTLFVVSQGFERQPHDCPQKCVCFFSRINWVVDCSHRGLASTPSKSLSTHTYSLNLNDNRLQTLTLPANVKPRSLHLANNHFRELRRQDFQGLNLLLDVDLSGNKLLAVESNTFVDSPGLLSLNFQGNLRLSGPSSSEVTFLISRTLQSLNLAECGIKKVGSGFFTGTPSLRKIDLSGNPLTTIEENVFSSLSGLHELDLQKTRITHLSLAFNHDAPLRILNLPSTTLESSDLGALLGKLPHLEILDLKNTKMTLTTEQHSRIFSSLTWLKHLNLAGNKLQALDMTRALNNLENLEILDLSYCQLSSDSFSSDALKSLTRLRSLNLAGNTLTAINMTALMESIVRLNTLIVKNCSLESIQFLRQLEPLRSSLRSLDLSENPLGNDEVNAAGSIFPYLEELDVSHCGLTKVTRTAFSSATDLVHLAIAGNSITKLEAGALSVHKKLQNLYLQDCKLTGPPGVDVFPPGQEAPLRKLVLAGNPLMPQSYPLIPQHLSHLEYLDISKTLIKKLPSSALPHAKSLETLIMSDNPLEGNALPASLGTLAPNLKKIDIRRGNLKSLDPSPISNLNNLVKLYLPGNPWVCDCNLKELWNWAKSRGIALQSKGGEDTLKCPEDERTWAQTLDSLTCNKT